jgi:hypothetical protein
MHAHYADRHGSTLAHAELQHNHTASCVAVYLRKVCTLNNPDLMPFPAEPTCSTEGIQVLNSSSTTCPV